MRRSPTWALCAYVLRFTLGGNNATGRITRGDNQGLDGRGGGEMHLPPQGVHVCEAEPVDAGQGSGRVYAAAQVQRRAAQDVASRADVRLLRDGRGRARYYWKALENDESDAQAAGPGHWQERASPCGVPLGPLLELQGRHHFYFGGVH